MVDFFFQMVRYAGVGGVSAVFHYGTLVFLVEVLVFDPVLASAIASGVGAIVNYLLNYKFTFASARAHSQSVPRFVAVATSGAALNSGLMKLGVDVLGIHYILTQLMATVIVFFWNFLINRVWTFKGR